MNRCERCQNQRWLSYSVRWVDDKIASDIRPFGRDNWSAYGTLGIAGLLSSKALWPCPVCNSERRPPWSKTWTAPAAAPSSEDPTPF